MNLYDYPTLKGSLEDMISKYDDIPLSISQFGATKYSSLCRDFLSDCSEEFTQYIILEVLSDESTQDFISKQYTVSGGFKDVLDIQLECKASEYIDDMLDQVGVIYHREECYG